MALAVALRDEPIDVLLSSDLVRALETATILGDVHGLVPTRVPDLRELDIGDWTGLTRQQIDAASPGVLERFEGEDPEVRPGGGECRREIRERVRGAVAAIVQDHPGQRIALVTHLGVIRALLPGTEPDNAECCRAVRVGEMPTLLKVLAS